ncbi:MAG: DUF4249 family protein [Bacteroidales bacterium]|nr:DUF4249 family protein [Bacteroidales bacterium]
MNRILIYISCLILILLCTMTSCVRDVILDAEEKPTVVVECVLSNEEIQELRLNFTKGASKDEAEPLTDAVATLIDLTEGKTVGEFVRSTGDLWTLDYSAVPDHGYRIEIQVPGYDLIYAEDTMPQLPEITERHRGEPKVEIDQDNPWSSTPILVQYDGYMAITEEEREEGAVEYLTEKYGYHELWGSYYYIKSAPDAFLIYGMNYNEATGQHEMAGSICTDHPSAESFNLTGDIYQPDIYVLEETRHFVLHHKLQGASLYDKFLCISAGAEKAEKYFILSGSFTGKWYDVNNRIEEDREPYEDEGFLVVMAISDNYRHYLREACNFIDIKESTDMSAIYLRDNIYSNIKGGAGIFAASVSDELQWANRYTEIGSDYYHSSPGINDPWTDSIFEYDW